MIYAVAYAAILGCLLLIWMVDPGFLYVGRDGHLALWLARTQAEWGAAGALTSPNPFQGMVSMMLPVNSWWIPASLLTVGLPTEKMVLFSFALYHAEFTASVLILGRALGFSLGYSFFAAAWLTVLLFPPLNYLFGLHAWVGSAPVYAHTLALGNLMAAVLVFLGSAAPRAIAAKTAAAALFPLVLLAYVFATPLYNAGMLVGYGLLFGAIIAATPGLRRRAWQAAPLVLCVVLAFALGAPDFFRGAFGVSGRFARETTSLLSLLEPRDVGSLSLAWQGAQGALCGWGILCEAFPPRYSVLPSITGSAWLHASIFFGAMLLAVRERGTAARIGVLVALLWAMLLLYWSAVAMRVLLPGPLSPLYVYLPLFTMLGLLSAYPLKLAGEGLRWLAPKPVLARATLNVLVLGASLGLLAAVAVWSRGVLPRDASIEPPLSPLVGLLQKEAGLAPGQPFRGSVVTILGQGLGPDRRADEFQRHLDAIGSSYGNTHALLDLWWFSIPTLEEYGQAITFPLRTYARRLLRDPADPAQSYFVMATRAEPRLLELLGVRFVLTDGVMRDAALRGELPFSGSRRLRLYELAAPNLGNVSPTRVLPGKPAGEILAAIAADPAILRSTAFTASAVPERLLAARSARMVFQRGGLVEISARSDGTSALLLPMQYSNCLSVDTRGGAARIVRANLLHTLLVFSGDAQATVRWNYGFGPSAGCRLRDAADYRALGLRD